MSGYDIFFEPDGIKVTVSPGMTLIEAAAHGGIILNGVCGGAGTCNKCLVTVQGVDEPVKSCQYRVDRDMVVEVPEESRFFEQKILQEGLQSDARVDPLVCKHYVELSEPALGDLRSDAKRLTDAVKDSCGKANRHTCRDHMGTASVGTTVGWHLLSRLPGLFRDHHFAVTAVCHSGRIFAIEPGDTTGVLYGAAVDIGTTTVVVSLVNLLTGHTVGVASETNPQVTFGDDVISRINYTSEKSEGLAQLNRRIVDCINKLIGDVCKKSLINPWQIYELTVAGNATMQHLFLEIPVEQIAQAPYVSVVADGVNVQAASLGVSIHPEGNIYVMPSVAAHVGGDTVAVGLATAMHHSDTINLAIDIGTNGELLLGSKKRMITCSTAAGPAFEGARIRFGMRGAAGAIEQVKINDDIEVSVIGGVKPTGICGSGLIDALAVLIKAGIVDVTGRLLASDDLDDGVSDAIRRRCVKLDNEQAFVLVWEDETPRKENIVLTQRDIREAQLGKAAIIAGIMTLIKELDISLADIDRLYLAGAFGNYINPASAQAIGLLPEIPLEKVQFVGNAAGAGAKDVLINQLVRHEAERLGITAEYIELAGRADFQDTFSDCMFFGEM